MTVRSSSKPASARKIAPVHTEQIIVPRFRCSLTHAISASQRPLGSNDELMAMSVTMTTSAGINEVCGTMSIPMGLRMGFVERATIRGSSLPADDGSPVSSSQVVPTERNTSSNPNRAVGVDSGNAKSATHGLSECSVGIPHNGRKTPFLSTLTLHGRGQVDYCCATPSINRNGAKQ